MSHDGGNAEKKFWKMPELVERLVLFLDGESTMLLARCHKLALQVLQHPTVWNKFIRRSCPRSNIEAERDRELYEHLSTLHSEHCALHKDKMMHLAAILDLVEGEDSLKMKMDLIQVFCERFLVDDDAQSIKGLEISFSCPHGNLKTETSTLGFLLLEETKLAVVLTVEHTSKKPVSLVPRNRR